MDFIVEMPEGVNAELLVRVLQSARLLLARST
jgi:hypothetical protein